MAVVVSNVPPPLSSADDFKTFFPALCEDGPGSNPQALAQLMVEATAAIEDLVDRRLAPFSGVVESHRLFGIDPDEYGASTDSPLDIYGSLGLSQAAAYQDDNLVRKFWLDQAAPHYTELWSYSISTITLHLTYGSTIAVDPSSLEGPYPDTGEIRMRLGTFAPEGTNVEVVYGGGYTVAIPASLQRLCRYQAAKLLILDMEPQRRKEMAGALSDIDAQIASMMSAWGALVSIGYEPLEGGAELEDALGAMVERASDWEPAFGAIIESFHAIEKRRFDDNGPGWLPLAEATITMTGSWARSNQNFDQILQDTGVLVASITGEGEGSYQILTPESVEVGTTVPYAHWHQTGGFRLHPSGAGWPPQRKIVDLDESAAQAWGAILQGWLSYGEAEIQTVT